MKSNKLLALMMAFAIFTTTAFAASGIPIYIEGKVADTSSTPAYVSTSSKTMIPVRKVGELLGLKVDWQSPYVILSGKSLKTNEELTVKIDAKTDVVTLNGTVMRNVIESKAGRSYITLRVLAEAFGYQVDWRNKCVYIDKPQNNNSTSQDSGADQNKDQVTNEKNQSFNEQVLSLVNAERVKAGLAALQLDEALCKVALIKSNDMRQNKYFSHTSPTYGSPFDMMKQFGISYSAAAENIAQGYTTPQAVVTGWMNSSGHRANILNGTYTHMGVGYDSNGHYWTQMFIKK